MWGWQHQLDTDVWFFFSKTSFNYTQVSVSRFVLCFVLIFSLKKMNKIIGNISVYNNPLFMILPDIVRY